MASTAEIKTGRWSGSHPAIAACDGQLLDGGGAFAGRSIPQDLQRLSRDGLQEGVHQRRCGSDEGEAVAQTPVQDVGVEPLPPRQAVDAGEPFPLWEVHSNARRCSDARVRSRVVRTSWAR